MDTRNPARLTASDAELRLVAIRFHERSLEWRLADREMSALLRVPVDRERGWPAFAGLPGDAERRVRRLLRLEGMVLGLLPPGESFGAWLRAANPGLRGLTPLLVLVERDEALGAMLSLLAEECRDVYGEDGPW